MLVSFPSNRCGKSYSQTVSMSQKLKVTSNSKEVATIYQNLLVSRLTAIASNSSVRSSSPEVFL